MTTKLDQITKELSTIKKKLKKLENEKEFMSLKETAKFMGIGTNAIYQLKDAKDFPVVQTGPRTYRVPRRALIVYMTKKALAREFEAPTLKVMGGVN